LYLLPILLSISPTVTIVLLSVCSPPSSYAIVGYDNVKDAEQAAEEHSSAVLDNYELAVYYFPSIPRPATSVYLLCHSDVTKNIGTGLIS